MLRLVREMGLPSSVLRPISAMYKGSRRRFRVGASVGQAFRLTNGSLQGCILSVVLLNALVSVLLEAVSREVKGAEPQAYADDVGALMRRRRDVQKVADVTREFAILTGQQINAKKSHAFSTALVRHRPIRLGEGCVRWVEGVCSLGAEVVARDGFQRERTEARILSACQIARRVG